MQLLSRITRLFSRKPKVPPEAPVEVPAPKHILSTHSPVDDLIAARAARRLAAEQAE